MSLLGFLEWLANTPWSIALHESLYMYPLIESTHVLALTLFVGLATILDLRLLGLTLTRVPVSRNAGPGAALDKVGFAVMFMTGLLLFYAIPVRNYQNIFFRVKDGHADPGWAQRLVFHRAWRSGRRLGSRSGAAKAARVAASSSLILWAGIVVAGRMIAYNWFDCDIQPQPEFINWAAGCVVPVPDMIGGQWSVASSTSLAINASSLRTHFRRFESGHWQLATSH